jgi:transposase
MPEPCSEAKYLLVSSCVASYAAPLREVEEVCQRMPGIDEPLLRLSPQEREEVRAALRREDLSPRVRERLEMIKAADLGRDLGEIAAWSGRTPRTVRRWLGTFAGGGIEALADAPRSGRPVVADAAYLEALGEALETPPPKLGLGFDVWTSERLSAYLARTKGIRIAPGWLRVLLGEMRFACGRPKHTLSHLRDPEEVAACEAELEEAEKK